MIFKRNNKDEFEKQLIETLNGINDTLNSNNTDNGFEDKLNDTECRLMEEIGAVNSNFDNLKKGVNEYTKTIGNLCNRIDEQDKIIKHLTRETDENYMLITKQEKRIKQLVSVIEKLTGILDLKNNHKIGYSFNEIKEPTIRKYPESIRKHKPKVVVLRNDGKFKLKNGTISKWNINHLLYLKKLIPQTELTTSKIAEKVKLKENTVMRLCCAIEDGDFDKYFDEWEQINANNTYGNWKPQIVNNPQKRRENGYV